MFKSHIPNVRDDHKELQHLPNSLETTPNVFFRFGDISNYPPAFNISSQICSTTYCVSSRCSISWLFFVAT